MFAKFSRRGFLGTAAALLASGSGGTLWAQSPDPYRVVNPVTLPLDKPGIYTLNFRYAPPRIVTVDFPEKGKKQVWYMFFQVYNTTDGPQEFIPEFELVTRDLNTSHLDEPQPYAVKEIRKLEDRTGALDLQTSISISKKKIPMTKPDSVPRYTSGIAVWTDVPERASQTNRFSVYITGLSNGVVTIENMDGSKRVQRKALRL
ncbi:MAG: twin-arginine translocation signal domain-containing protein, partial [Gemmataceae bacterium]